LPKKGGKKAVQRIWVSVKTPAYLGEKHLSDAPCTAPEDLLGRTLEALLYDITGDPAHSFMKLKFKITGVKGNECATDYWGHEISRDYITSILRKGSSRVDAIFDVTTKDSYAIRVRTTIITRFRISTSKKRILRKGMVELISNKVPTLTLGQFAQEVAAGKVESDIYNFAKKVVRVKFTGITKAKVLRRTLQVLTQSTTQT
jgi:small subunit ribosomal protein S3Ae